MDEEYIEEEAQYQEEAPEEKSENDDVNSAEEGFMKGYDDESDDVVAEDVDEDELLTD
ncbi:MAG: hypothetical protein ACI8Y7_000819 [Candidatus Woesearchaeota archaeon]|jgi:hypothetical protein